MTENPARSSEWRAGAQDEETVAHLRRVLTQAIGRVCPPWLEASREDLVQAACIKVLALLNEPERNRGLQTSYLWKVAHTTVVDEIRRLARQRESLKSFLSEGDPAASAMSPERGYRGFQIGRALLECLSTLVRTRRIAVALHLQGSTVPEVAGHLGWSLKKAENMVYRGLSQLRICLTEKGWKP